MVWGLKSFIHFIILSKLVIRVLPQGDTWQKNIGFHFMSVNKLSVVEIIIV